MFILQTDLDWRELYLYSYCIVRSVSLLVVKSSGYSTANFSRSARAVVYGTNWFLRSHLERHFALMVAIIR